MGPNGQPGPHDNETKQSTVTWDRTEPVELTDGGVSGDEDGTSVTASTSRID